MVTIHEHFQLEGTLAFVMDRLNSWARIGAMLVATPFNSAEMLTRSFDLDVPSSCNRSKTSSSVHSNSSGQVAGSVGSGSLS